MENKLAEASSETVTEKKPMYSWTQSEKENSKKKYGVEIMIENGSLDQVRTKDCPNDARIVTYEVDGEIRYDLTRSQKAVNIFDMYYDKFGKGLKNIDYGEGRHNPKALGSQSTPNQKEEVIPKIGGKKSRAKISTLKVL